MATEVTHIVDPGEGAGHDYHSLSLWEAGEVGDLTGVRDEISVAKCRATDGDADTTAVVLDGWITSPTQYIKIWTDPAESHRHDGKWNTSKYRLTVSGAYTIQNSENYTKIDGIQFSGNTGAIYRGLAIGDLSNCILNGLNTNNLSGVSQESGGAITCWNVVAFNFGTGASGFISYTNGSNFRNCTAFNCDNVGIENGYADAVATNCVALTCGSCFDGGIVGNYNCSSDTTAPGANSLKSKSAANNFVDIGAGTEDLHLKLGADCINTGTDLSAYFTTDIDGTTRPTGANTWDIGADEYVMGYTKFIMKGNEEFVMDVFPSFKIKRKKTFLVS